MRLFLLIGLSLLASASAFVGVQQNYHEAVGIPLATRIKASEDAAHARMAVVMDGDRIVGGAAAPANAHPYLAGLVIRFFHTSGVSACGSSVITANRLVTAAHCWNDGANQAASFEAVLGSAFLFFGGSRILTTSVVITTQLCQASFTSTYVTASSICTSGWGGVGICGGDSGGPLFILRNGRPVLVGISSFVADIGCQLGHPSVFARVTRLALVTVASGLQDVQKGYHEAVGIPEAARIQAAEDQVMARSGILDNYSDRIVGGAMAPANAHPYLAGLVISLVGVAGNSVCGSSLLSGNRLVTAAHCWFDGWNQGTQFVVVLGSQYLFSGGTRIATSTVIMHPQWTPSTLGNDVAMIYLPTNVFFTTLPSGWDLFETFAGQWSVAAGYGKTSDAQAGVTVSTMVSQVNLQVITVAQCQAVFGATFVQTSTICTNGAGGVGICGGDSGGPLVINRNGVPTLVGISSFVASNGCQLGFPSAFARVTSFNNFIQQHLF
ncbi:Chymotrypsin-like serine protease [Operophtera brumata]|uniref:Chymotrypsin-like serine protease n=1 Tax=Operophtera brumata TaxID=104452 RepID=A0A0L7LI04_OPEBR|nr:Chymotrypsin-like serine protease [Operophtera brumata]